MCPWLRGFLKRILKVFDRYYFLFFFPPRGWVHIAPRVTLMYEPLKFLLFVCNIYEWQLRRNYISVRSTKFSLCICYHIFKRDQPKTLMIDNDLKRLRTSRSGNRNRVDLFGVEEKESSRFIGGESNCFYYFILSFSHWLVFTLCFTLCFIYKCFYLYQILDSWLSSTK